MTKKEFINWIYPSAKSLEIKGGVSAIFTVAQAALESGWGKSAIGNNLFGITTGSEWTGARKLVLTTEFLKTANAKFSPGEKIVSITKSGTNYKYRVYRWFRDYSTMEECLRDHQRLLEKSIYKDAWPYRLDPEEYARRLVDKVGGKYATSPNYAATMISLIKGVREVLKTM